MTKNIGLCAFGSFGSDPVQYFNQPFCNGEVAIASRMAKTKHAPDELVMFIAFSP